MTNLLRHQNNARGHACSGDVFLLLVGLALTSGCYLVRPASGGGQRASDERRLNAEDIAVPTGYRVELVAKGLTFPTGVAFDASGVPHVVESGYCYGEVWTTPRLVRLD